MMKSYSPRPTVMDQENSRHDPAHRRRDHVSVDHQEDARAPTEVELQDESLYHGIFPSFSAMPASSRQPARVIVSRSSLPLWQALRAHLRVDVAGAGQDAAVSKAERTCWLALNSPSLVVTVQGVVPFCSDVVHSG